MEDPDIHDLRTVDKEELEDVGVEQAVQHSTADAVQTSPEPTNPQLGALVQYWVDRALTFVSHASNETLGACFVGLGASTYLILGRVGLVLIGVVGGIALHATFEKSADGEGGKDGESKRRRELGLDVVHRVWNWRDRKGPVPEEGEQRDDMDDELQFKLLQGKPLDFSGFDPETAAALDTFTTAVIRDYVKWWYSPVLPGEESFPATCRRVLTAFLLSLSGHISRKRPTEMFINFVINSSSVLIVFLSELSAALNASPNADAATAIVTYVEMKPDSSLAQMLNEPAQGKKLDLVAEDILQNYLDPKGYNFPPVHGFLQQILSKLILSMTLETCSKPEWINGWIVHLLEDGEPELMQAIDEELEKSTDKNSEIQPAAVGSTAEAKKSDHNRRRSRAEEAMEEALVEARRLTQLIQEDEAKKLQAQVDLVSSSEDVSEDMSKGMRTPTSSQSESERMEPSTTTTQHEAIMDQISAAPPATLPSDTQQFLNFDQLVPATPPVPTEDSRPILTLHNGRISIFDDSVPGEKTRMKSKPTVDYLIQIEPLDSRFSGWMIARKYVDFEVLHEVLRRISVITGARFADVHPALPNWKQLDKPTFRTDLELYLMDALKFQALAESEGMKRFLEKDQGLQKSPAAGKGLGWPDPLQMGKGMFDVLAKAPKEVAGGVAGGGKALFGGVTSVLGGVKKAPPAAARTNSSNSLSLGGSPSKTDRQSVDLMRRQTSELSRASTDSLERPVIPKVHAQESKSLPSTRASVASRPSTEVNTAVTSSTDTSTAPATIESMNLPPPPSAIDEYESPGGISPMTKRTQPIEPILPEVKAITSDLPSASPTKSKPTKLQTPMTEQEATVTVDLLFAVISELYTLSSAWTFRRTLLQAARTFLLRPGNPQLEAIRALIQESVIDANSSDAGIAKMILKVRENGLPTEEELKAWPAPLGEREKEELRVKARRLLVERGMPQALTSVMGAAASGEALGKVFDCLQIRGVARSVMFGMMLQALRAAVQ